MKAQLFERKAMSDYAPTTPDLPTDSGVVKTSKQFSDALTLDLTDAQAAQSVQIIKKIKDKYQAKFIAKFNSPGFTIEDAEKAVDEMADEMVYTLASEADMLATVDGTPVLEGEPPMIEIVGALSGHSVSQYGMDHERKAWEVKKATDRGEAFLGEKGTTDAAKAKNRDKRR
jgi:hypothetical protein